MERIVLQQTVRTVLALCQFAASCEVDDVRADALDEAAALIDMTTSVQSDARIVAVSAWCRQVNGWLGRLQGVGGIDGTALLRAQARVLRLLAVADEKPEKKMEPRARPKREQKAVIAEPTTGQSRIVEWLRGNRGARNRELVAHFAGDMSPRTVKRSLSNLLAMGLVCKSKTETGGVTYDIVER